VNIRVPPTFKLRKLWLTIGWLLIVLVIYLSLTPGWLPLDALADDEVSHRFTYGISHVLAYGTLMLWFLQLYPVSRRPIIALCLVGLGGLLEILQAFTPERDPDYLDALANGTGVVLGWLLGRTRLANTLEAVEKALVPWIDD
jgi:VanZ family protein